MTRIYHLETPKPNCWILRIAFYLRDSYYGSLEIGFTLTDIHICEYSHRFVGLTLSPAAIVSEMSLAFNKVVRIRNGEKWQFGADDDGVHSDIFSDFDLHKEEF